MLRALLILPLALAALPACARREPVSETRQYPLRGQVLAVDVEGQQLTVRHEDIPGLMPGMTMTFPVAAPDLMEGREPGELIVATLEVTDAAGRLTAITRTGLEPLPEGGGPSMAVGLLEVGDQVPDTAFIDQDDRRRSLAEWQGTYTLLTFIYTRCPLPNFCPLMDQNFLTIQQSIAGDDALRGQLRLISVSFDPEFDRPPVLAAYAAKRRAEPDVWTFLTGDRTTIERFATSFGIGLIRLPEAPDEITHNLRTALLDPDLRVHALYSGNEWTPAQVLDDLREALRQP